MDSAKRFSNRVKNYIAARPDYPKAIIQLLKEQCNLNANSIVADIGSGTGLFTKLLLEEHVTVYGVEPNAEMRQAAEVYLAQYPGFKSIDGRADQTNLPNHSVDLITAAQAYHWFNNKQTHDEFIRILKPQGSIFLVWNLRQNDTSFMQDYEQLLIDYGTDYLQVSAEKTNEQPIEFGHHSLKTTSFANTQDLNWNQLKSRLLSCSYIPTEHEPNYSAMMKQLQHIYDKHQKDGIVRFNYITKCYYLNLT